MERSRKRKILLMLILGVTIAGLSIGFAAFSGVLNISSSANVSVNSDTFSVKFSTSKDSLVVNDVEPSYMSPGISANAGVIDNSTNPTITNLSATFTEPGQYVEYTFYARNEGEYTAYLNSINYFGEKTCDSNEMTSNVQSACDSIALKVYVDDSEYLDTIEISGHSLEKKTGEEIRVIIDYPSTGGWADAPFNVTFPNIMMIYSTINDSAFVPEGSPLLGTSLVDIMKENAILDTDVDFSKVFISGKYIRNGTENNSNPVYYYRGNDVNNNLLFANFCWKIVRTTDTGGIKLIYNGVPAEDGSCDNTGTASHISAGKFNKENDSPTFMGYMYGTDYDIDSYSLNNQTDVILYGNDFEWDGTNYKLVDTISSADWSTDKDVIGSRYHYTCLNSSGVCSSVYYIIFQNNSALHHIILKNGENIEQAKEKMFANTNDSEIKKTIDNWFKTNLLGYESWLEDTVWCNDRTIYSGSLLNKDSAVGGGIVYNGYYRNREIFKPTLKCDEVRDSFSVSSDIGNGKLTYPVGLLTGDEMTLSGHYEAWSWEAPSPSAFMYINLNQWTMTPAETTSAQSSVHMVYIAGTLGSTYVNFSASVRPTISLKKGTTISGGDGTVDTPYVVE